MKLTPSDMKFVPKIWGWELWIVNNERFCGKILFIKAGQQCSLHSHRLKEEVLFIYSGECWFRYKEPSQVDHTNPIIHNDIVLKANEAFHVTPGTRHQMCAVTDVTIFEISTQHFDSDSYREYQTSTVPE